MPLKDRVFIVTGASGNVGRAAVQRLRQEGARVASLTHRAPGAGEGTSPDHLLLHAELTDESSVEAAFGATERAFGPLWAVLHIAGGWEGGHPISETPLDLLDRMLATNVRSGFLVTRAAMRRLVPQGGGRIVAVGAYTAASSTQLADSGAYNIAKAGEIALTKVLAEEGRAHGVFANCVAPGTIDTPQNRAAMPKADFSKWVPVEAVVHALLGAAAPESALTGAVLTLPSR